MKEDETEYGPGMRALTLRQRKFVLAMAADPFANQTQWARAAGFREGGQSYNSLKVAGHRLAHDPKVQAACAEVAKAHSGTFGPTSMGLHHQTLDGGRAMKVLPRQAERLVERLASTS
jgi:phage terminase small subunit